ncbi:MAG: hypothetical protein U9Q03_02860 [Patescibacteria group bacterium]|nr:hypothetical protein [Patescibacteria group bacterium]
MASLFFGGLGCFFVWLYSRQGNVQGQLSPAEETKSLSKRSEPALPVVSTGIIEGGQGPYRRLDSEPEADKIAGLTDDEKLTKLMIASCCDGVEPVENERLKDMARSLPIRFLADSLERGADPQTTSFVLGLRDLPSDVRGLDKPLTSTQYHVRLAARRTLAAACGWEKVIDILARLVADENFDLKLRQEFAQAMAEHEVGLDRLKSMTCS